MTEREKKYINDLENDLEFALEMFKKSVTESDQNERQMLYEIVVEACVVTRGG